MYGGEKTKEETYRKRIWAMLFIAFILIGFDVYLNDQYRVLEQKREASNLDLIVHLTVEHYRDGKLLSYQRHAGVLTNGGADWIELLISGAANASKALYISTSNSADSPSAAWTNIPTEIAANGLTRDLGAYASAGVGTWNVTKTFSVSGTQSVQLYGLSWDSDTNGGGLLCSDTSAQKNCVNGDTLKVTFQITVS